MTGTVIAGPDGIYDPAMMNDRLLLGMKGTMSEFELNLLRQRSAEAIRQKAWRGELQFNLPAGYVWTGEGGIEKEPDRRVRQALCLVFAKMVELGSARQVLLWLRRENIELPRKSQDRPGGRLGVRKDQDQNQSGGWPGAQDRGPQKTARRRDGLDSGAPSQLHFLGAVRTQPGHHGNRHSHAIAGAAESRPWRARAVERYAALPEVRAHAVCFL